MPSHIHLLASAGMNGDLSAIMRDFKKFTSKKIIKTIKVIPESRREWMLDRFEFAGRFDKRITNYKRCDDSLLARRYTPNGGF